MDKFEVIESNINGQNITILVHNIVYFIPFNNGDRTVIHLINGESIKVDENYTKLVEKIRSLSN